MKILVLNGPNLNLLGTREPEKYGRLTLDDLSAGVKNRFPTVDFTFLQSNHEGDLISALHQAQVDELDGVVLNAGAYTHTSIGLRDAIAAISVPVIEVHITNVHAREKFRHHSMIAPACVGQIAGLGTQGYHLAVHWFLAD